MDLDGLLRICKAYRNLGDAVASQIHDAADAGIDECNSNALEMIEREFLREIVRVAAQQVDLDLLDEVTALSARIAAHLKQDDDCSHCGGDGIANEGPTSELGGEGEDRPCPHCT